VLLWPDFDTRALSSNLRTTLSYLQALLEPERSRGDAPWFLQQEAGTLALRTDRSLRVDAWEVTRSLDVAADAAASGAVGDQLVALLAAIDLWHGDHLVELRDLEWSEAPRRRLHERLVAAAVRAGELLLASGRIDEAARVARIGLDREPYAESLSRTLASAHLAAGDRNAARLVLVESSDRLAELGVDPEPASVALADRLAQRRG
jgi:DNA-binding SARP family transcriptional activator